MLASTVGTPQRIVVRALQAVVAAGVLLFVASTLPGAPSGVGGLLDEWVLPGMVLCSGLLCLSRAFMVRRARLAWATLGLGLALYAAGVLYWRWWVLPLRDPPYRSPADLLELSFYPLAYVAVVLLVHRRVRRVQTSMWLDGITAGLGASALGAGLVFHTILQTTAGSVAAIAVTLSYPLADLLLLMLVIGSLVGLGRPDRALWLLALGMMVFAAADTIYLFRVATETYEPGSWLDALLVVAHALLGFAAWQPPARRPDRGAGATAGAGAAVAVALSSIGILVLDHFRPVSTLAVMLATGTLLTVVVRTTLTFREIRSLAESRRLAHTDDLTGLGNRRMLYGQLENALAKRADDRAVALLIVDLDRFKGCWTPWPSRSTWKASPCMSTPASAWRCAPSTPTPPPRSCNEPTWPCTRPKRATRAGGPTPSAVSSPPATGSRPSRTSGSPWTATSWSSTTSPRSTPAPAASSASKPWSAGTTPPRACCTPTGSSPWPNRPASCASSPWWCCRPRSANPRPGGTPDWTCRLPSTCRWPTCSTPAWPGRSATS
jgi:hypothetical protein